MPLLSIPFKIVVGKSSKNPKVAHFFSKTDTPSCTMHNLVTSKHHDSIVVVVVITLGTLLQRTKNSSKGSSSSWSDPSFHFILEQAYPSLSLCDFDGSVAVNPNCPQMLGNSSVSLIMVIGRRERERTEKKRAFSSHFFLTAEPVRRVIFKTGGSWHIQMGRSMVHGSSSSRTE